MDYHAIHGHDIASFDTSSTHRLPTVSASQALDELRDDPSSHVPTGLEDLDQVLLNSISIDSQGSTRRGGVKRGQLTEIWGPPGTGKTAIGLQLAANALCSGDAVVWVDCFQTVSSERITTVVNAAKEKLGRHASGDEEESDESRFFHYSCLTLPHFIALVSRPTAKSIAANAALIIVSSLSALINSALPKGHDGRAPNRPNKGPSSSAKRLQALQSIMAALQKLAATRNCAVVILSQCATKIQSERGATLTPSVNATVWEQGVSTRLVLFRDWVWRGNKLASVLLAGLQKVDGKPTQDSVENVVAFKVETDGIIKVPYDATQSLIDFSNLPLRKRKLGQTELEVPDSEDDEDYGWAEEDEAALPAPPPQWQGSEDLLLGQKVGQSEEDSDGNGNGDSEENHHEDEEL
ncbi:Fc.00g090420.m01.CDS01 [Cosmosporella sp. VM-42]